MNRTITRYNRDDGETEEQTTTSSQPGVPRFDNAFPFPLFSLNDLVGTIQRLKAPRVALATAWVFIDQRDKENRYAEKTSSPH